jgi:hypothetical protein
MRRAALLLSLMLVASTDACPAEQPPDTATVVGRKAESARRHYIEIDPDGDEGPTWIKVRRPTYRACHVHDRWPSCQRDDL